MSTGAAIGLIVGVLTTGTVGLLVAGIAQLFALMKGTDQ